MSFRLKGISRNGWKQLASWTVLGTLGCVAISLAINFLVFVRLGGEPLVLSMVSATVIPVILAGPLFFYLSLKLRELAIANHKLSDAATIDRLTMCLNRGAFSTMVEASMFRQSDGEQRKAGAFLVIDADHFKSVNDRFGHDQGDEALRLISAAIRSQIRSGDLVGRLGGEEFGVYLPGADQHEAALVAERIRDQVKKAAFRPGGKECVLTVSVGGATFSQAPAFAEMFRLADERLYDAKHAGRDRVRLVSYDAAGHAAHASYLH